MFCELKDPNSNSMKTKTYCLKTYYSIAVEWNKATYREYSATNILFYTNCGEAYNSQTSRPQIGEYGNIRLALLDKCGDLMLTSSIHDMSSLKTKLFQASRARSSESRTHSPVSRILRNTFDDKGKNKWLKRRDFDVQHLYHMTR